MASISKNERVIKPEVNTVLFFFICQNKHYWWFTKCLKAFHIMCNRWRKTQLLSVSTPFRVYYQLLVRGSRGPLYPHTVALNRTPSSRLLPPFQRPPLSPLDRGAWQIDGKRCTIIAHYGLGWSAPIILKQSCLPGQGLCATWCRDRWGPLIKAGRGRRDWCGEIQMLMQHLED